MFLILSSKTPKGNWTRPFFLFIFFIFIGVEVRKGIIEEYKSMWIQTRWYRPTIPHPCPFALVSLWLSHLLQGNPGKTNPLFFYLSLRVHVTYIRRNQNMLSFNAHIPMPPLSHVMAHVNRSLSLSLSFSLSFLSPVIIDLVRRATNDLSIPMLCDNV